MTNWQRTLVLAPEWEQAQSREITPQQMAAVISKRLSALAPFKNHPDLDFDREELAAEFEAFSEESEADADDFDHIMNALYDWADLKLGGDVFNAKKVCWIEVFQAKRVAS